MRSLLVSSLLVATTMSGAAFAQSPTEEQPEGDGDAAFAPENEPAPPATSAAAVDEPHTTIVRSAPPPGAQTTVVQQPAPRRYGDKPQADVPSSDDESSGRRKVELFWLRPTAGYAVANLTTFEADTENLTGDLIPTRLAGPEFGLGAGLRLMFISFAVNGKVDLFNDDSQTRTVDNLQLWTLDGNILLHLLTGYRVEPYVQLGGGYSAFAGIDDALGAGSGYRVSGWNVHGGIGLDYFVEDNISIGALLSGQLMFLSRPGTSATALLTPQKVDTVGQARDRLLEADGSSIGTGFSIVAGPGLHF